jgi:predicted nucleic acid-binding protein
LRLLIDTNVLSELSRPSASEVVTKRMGAIPSERLFLSVITLGEISKGVALLALGARRRSLETWQIILRRDYASRILDVNTSIAELWGVMEATAKRSGRAVAMADGLIAATSIHYDLVVATRNVRDIIAAGAKAYDPWTDMIHDPHA